VLGGTQTDELTLFILKAHVSNVSGKMNQKILEELQPRAEKQVKRHQPPRLLSPKDVYGNIYGKKQGAVRSMPFLLMADGLKTSCTFSKTEATKKRIWPSGKHAAVALWVAGRQSCLLGADLEEQKKHTGWVASGVPYPTNRKASVFKLPHHGSETGYNSTVWQEMLHDSSLAILTPYSRGRRPLPQKSDMEKICRHTDKIFMTTPVYKSRTQKRDSAVEKTLKDLGITPRLVNTSFGHVRLRAKQG
jgi:hypothetical protein